MRVLVTGGYGLIGSAVLARLHREGHELVGAGRDLQTARRRFPFCRWIEADFRKLTQPEDWAPLLADIDAVVNCVGVLQDGIRDDVRRVQADATIALFAACEAAGVRRVVHVSAIGAEAGAPSDFARSKATAENDLARRDLDWAILRPALVLAPAAYGGTALLRAVAAFPLRHAARRGRSARPDRRHRRSDRDRRALSSAGCAGEGPLGYRAPRGVPASGYRGRDAGLARICAGPVVPLPRWKTLPSAAAPTRSDGSAGGARRAQPRLRSFPPVSSATRPPGWRRPASSRRILPRRSPAIRPASRTAGSRGSIS